MIFRGGGYYSVLFPALASRFSARLSIRASCNSLRTVSFISLSLSLVLSLFLSPHAVSHRILLTVRCHKPRRIGALRKRHTRQTPPCKGRPLLLLFHVKATLKVLTFQRGRYIPYLFIARATFLPDARTQVYIYTRRWIHLAPLRPVSPRAPTSFSSLS